MIYQNVELHNVVEIENHPGLPGVVLRRVPRAVREKLDVKTRRLAGLSSGCEIRFVVDEVSPRVSLMAQDDTEVQVYAGDFLVAKHAVPGGVIKTLALESPPGFANVKASALHRTFSPNVWRIGCNRTDVALVGIETFGAAIRPPSESEKPRTRWLAYGSSITHSNFETGYPHVAARMLGVDVLNLGHSGSCRAESAMADFLATRNDWDFATAELGINMRGSFTTDEFRDRCTYLIHRIVDANPTKPVCIITHFPTGATHRVEEDQGATREREFDQTLRDIVSAKKHPKLHLIEGASILDRFDLHTIDLVHPSTVGQVRMGMNLAQKLSELIA